MRRWLAALERLSSALHAGDNRLVVTHGEPHPGNLMRVETGFRLVDWDTVAFSVHERDLWMLAGGGCDDLAHWSDVSDREVDGGAIAYYRLAWSLSDIANFVVMMRSEHSTNAGTEKAFGALRSILEGTAPGPYAPVEEELNP